MVSLRVAADGAPQHGLPAAVASAPLSCFPGSFAAEVYEALLVEQNELIKELLKDPGTLDPDLVCELRLHCRPDTTFTAPSNQASSPSSSEHKRVRLAPASPQAASPAPTPHVAVTTPRHPLAPTQLPATSSSTKFSFSEGFLLSTGLPLVNAIGPPGGGEGSPAPASLPSPSAATPATKADRKRLRNINYKRNPPPHVREKKAERSKRKFEMRQEQAIIEPLPVEISETERRGEWTATRKKGEKKGAYRVVGAGDSWPNTLSAKLVDASGRLIGYRAFGSLQSVMVNDLCIAAVGRIDLRMRVQFGGSHPRGTHSVRLFMIHRTQVEAPCHNAFMVQNLPEVLEFAKMVAPVVEFAGGIFRNMFPKHHDYYLQSIKSIVNHPSLPRPLHHLFGPWASCCINSGGKVCTFFHTDNDNYWGGFCCIIPFGNFDWCKSAFLVIHIDGEEDIAFALPPGVPFFLPSAVLAHYNTEIVGDWEVRGSLVLWTSGKVFQWLAQDGRAVKQLSRTELKAWLEGAQGRWLEALERYPFM